VPAPKKYVSRKFSPFHARVLFLFDQLKQGNHICSLANLYNSTKIAGEAYGSWCYMQKWLQATLLHPARRIEESKGCRKGDKAAVLEGEESCPNLVVFIVYDTKPVLFLSVSCTSLKWVEKVKLVFDKKTEKHIQMMFLSYKVNDD
jgi:hypothetical protein